jgi:hypothetical protein
MQVVANETKPSRKLIAEWSRDEQVGIWDNCTATIRLYADRAVYKGNTVRWTNNSGSLAALNRRITGAPHRKLLELAAQQAEDDADYADDAFEAVMYSLE